MTDSKKRVEEISDILTDKAFLPVKDGGMKKGHLLKFTQASLVITKIDRKNKRAWAKHVETHNHKNVFSHTGHDVTGGGPGDLPFCNDCQVNINQPSTEDGDKKALDRRDRREREYLSDGTKIE